MKYIKEFILITIILLNSSCTKAQENKINNEQKLTEYESIIIGKKFKLFSKVLEEEKEIYISLPHKYEERVHSYPVVFVLEAEFLFESTSTISKFLAARTKMPQSIIIGIPNSSFKKRYEMDLKKWGGKPDKYLDFFKEELIPYINKNYRANSHRTIIGLSPTNGLLFEAFLNQPDIFKGYIALSAQLEWDRIDGIELIDEIISKRSDANYPKSTLYLGRADNDLKEQLDVQKVFYDAIKKLENSESKNVTCKIDILKKEEHYSMSLAGIRAGFELIYPNDLWEHPNWTGWEKNTNYTQDYKSYFDKLTSIYNFDIYPVEDGHSYGSHLSGKIYNAQRWGTSKQVIDFTKLAISYYPNSANLLMTLAEEYKKTGEIKLAIQMGAKAIELATKYHIDEITNYNERLQKIRN